jgi:hypothetical protein
MKEGRTMDKTATDNAIIKGRYPEFEAGWSINDWALPLHIEACRPFTTIDPKSDDARWVTQVEITFLCFYLAIRW